MEQRDLNIDKRARRLKQGRRGLGPVVYWMSRDQRVEDNWALLWAQQEALARQKPLEVVFCLVPDFPGANLRHYMFLLKGLQEVSGRLQRYKIGFRLLRGAPSEVLPPFLKSYDAHILACDFDPLRIKRLWQKKILESVSTPCWEIDAHNVIPAWVVSDKKEYAAYTIRPKIHRLLPDYLCDFPELVSHPFSSVEGENHCGEVDVEFLASTVTDRSLGEVGWCVPGENMAYRQMKLALVSRLHGYDAKRNDPCINGQSGLSPYLHFGHLSPQRLALETSRSELEQVDKDAFLEELIVRRELADNFCLYEPRYDSFHGFHNWAKQTLNEHRGDKREYLYSAEQFDRGETHEDLWNNCQHDLVGNGKLHGYLRMYWAKKILEWSASPEEAMETAIYLNDRYSLDGRDPNGYTGIAWSIGGIHDRAWQQRAVFGKIRYMNENGCRRKFAVDDYIQKVRT